MGLTLLPFESIVNLLLNLMRVTWDKTMLEKNNYFRQFNKKL